MFGIILAATSERKQITKLAFASKMRLIASIPVTIFTWVWKGPMEISLTTGKVPRELSLLSHLEALHIVSNRNVTATLEDMIPVELQKDVNLKSLQFWGNDLISGAIPDHVWKMSHLQVFNIGGNIVEGKLDPAVGNLVNLTKLEVGSNKMTGTLPSELGALSALTTLIVDYNLFSLALPHRSLANDQIGGTFG
ncbi:receptor-like protein kinase precursor [Seminavis robusta]|uniref:Receptor-like protein kinase n=1 Tax=Seminavis robusta TaxID=568900 RepID=A0A9N8HHE5_9STRA|nr:receptor-like protein kinase precursor [Seminavis robusta]|eukprot:Sro701_g189710.1 receptor-like protein kinase precursor (194) ;mRNA; f:972-1622